MKDLKALCFSDKCAIATRTNKTFVIKDVKWTETFCPDCKSALVWTKEDKICHYSTKTKSKKTKDFTINGSDNF
jgi:hypothetical protein